MDVSRRWVTLGLTAGALGACTTGPSPGPAPKTPEPRLQSVPNTGFDAWVAAFRGRATARGISAATLNAAFRDAGYLPGVITRDRNQFQTRRSVEDYLAVATTDERIAKGKAMLRRHTGLLSEIEARYGVPAEVVTALWGMESTYGERRGNVPLVSALSTLAFSGRRGAFFESQLVAALKILQRGDITPGRMTGSWAGAMGHTQFIPTTYLAYAVDFRGDGRRDIWADDPTDALASAAAYLKRSGWRRGQPWGVEVLVTGGAPAGGSRLPSAWAALGVRAADSRTIPDHGTATLLQPGGAGGPAFLIFRNFSVFRRYNNSMPYALSVGHLSDRLKGGGPLRTGFGPDRNGLTLENRKEMQRRLTAKGFNTEGFDGVIGQKTIAAIQAYQKSRGLPVTGEPSVALLQMLRQA